jgi:tetratricopeptide (TPR) repeat protein
LLSYGKKFFKLFITIFPYKASSLGKVGMKRLIFIAIVVSVPFLAASQDPISETKADDLFNDGLVLLAHQQPGAAYDRFSEFLKEAPSNDARRKDAEYYTILTSVNLFHGDGEKRIKDFTSRNESHPRSASAFYDLGSLFYQQKNYTKAAANFAKADFGVLSAEQQNSGRFRWGYSLFAQKKLPEALEQFGFVKGLGGAFGPAASYYAGYIEYAQGDYENALIDLRRAELNEAYSTIVPYMIAQVLYHQQKDDELLKYVKSIETREDVSQADEIGLLAAEVNFRRKDFEEALKGYRPYVDERPAANRSVLFRAGMAAMRTSNDEEALELFKRAAAESDSVGAYASYYAGTLYLKAGQKPMALTAFDAARKGNGGEALKEEGNFQYAKVAYDAGRADESIDELEKFLTAYPSSHRVPEVKEILSHAYVDSNNYNKAIEYIESLPRKSPAIEKTYQKATYLKGAELFNMGHYPEAISFFEKSLSMPLDAEIAVESHYWCAEALSVGRKYESAIDHYSAIISPASGASRPLLTRARYGIAYAYYNNKQYDRALNNFREFTAMALKGDKDLTDGFLRLADCYYVQKQYADALTAYRKVLQAGSPDADYAHLQAGIVYQVQRKYAEASSEFNAVIRTEPPSAYREEALFQLAQVDFEQGKYANAVNGYTRVLEASKSSPFVPYAHMRRAAAYYNLKQYSKTADDYIVVVQNYSTHPVSHDVLVPLQEALGLANRAGEFEQYLAGFKSANPDAKGIESIEFETAKNLYFSQDYAKAIARLEGYVKAYPTSPRVAEAKFYQAESYYRLKDFPAALNVFQQIADDATFSMINKVVSRIAELHFKSGDFSSAVTGYQKLAAMASNKKEQFNAWSGLMESYYLLAAYDSSVRYARLILEKGNINPGAGNQASLYIGKNAMAKGDYETAKDEFLHTLNTAQDEYGAEAKYLLAEIFYLTGDHKQAYETLVSLNNDFAAYTEWVGKSYLLMADNSIASGDHFQARYTLKSLVDNFPLQEVKERAREKLRRLDEEEKKSIPQPDTTDKR